jgi:predicted AlkP superfamily phosphohydrolase/phosphomutase
MDHGSRSLFILALDGVPYSLLKRLITDGVMPNLKSLVQDDNLRQMNSVMPSISSVAWASFMTGKNPGGHGIYGFIERDPRTMEVYVPTAINLKSQTLWHYLSQKKKRVFVMNVPLTYPPQEINGISICGFLGTDISKGTYPAEIGRELKANDYRIDVDTVRARDDLEWFISELNYTYDKRIETMWRFFDQEPWDFFMLHVMETDRLHHFLWEYAENADLTWTAQFIDVYQKIDHLIGRIADILPANMEYMILSDHGFCTLKNEVYINKWLFDNKYLKFVAHTTPDSLHAIHPESTAYSLIPGRIYLNLQGREKNGHVQPGLPYETIRESLKNQLLQLKDEEHKTEMVKTVYTREELYLGEQSVGLNLDHSRFSDTAHPFYLAPDLFIMPHDGFDFKGNLWRQTLTEKGSVVGTHTYHDAFMLVKDHILVKDSFSIVDAMPTVLHLMNIEPPNDLQGKVVVDE